MNYRKPVCLVVILMGLLLSLNVIAQQSVGNGNDPNIANNRGDLAENVVRMRITGKHLIVVGYGGLNEGSCAGYVRADSFIENKLRRRIEEVGISVAGIEPVDGGYFKEPWIDVYVINPGDPRPKFQPPDRLPSGEDCTK